MAEREGPKVGDRITITAMGTTATGTVISALNCQGDRSGKLEHIIELRDDDGHAWYWKSEIDGGSWAPAEPEPTPEERRQAVAVLAAGAQILARIDRDLYLADVINGLKPGHGVRIDDHMVWRLKGRDTELYTVDGAAVVGFFEAWQLVTGRAADGTPDEARAAGHDLAGPDCRMCSCFDEARGCSEVGNESPTSCPWTWRHEGPDEAPEDPGEWVELGDGDGNVGYFSGDYDGTHCKHGRFIGYPGGPDYLCPLCELGE